MTLEVLKQFTCISYDQIDFLIPSVYVVAGFYQQIENNAQSVMFNRETLPHLHIGNVLEREFHCKRVGKVGVVLVMKMQDFSPDVCVNISDYTETAFPASGFLAISINGEICSEALQCDELHLLPWGIREKMSDYGISAIRFPHQEHKQLLIAPDLLIRKFFSGALL